MRVHITARSSNRKVGPLPVTTTEPDSCPDTCPLKNGGGCYAEGGPLAMHWRKVGDGSRGGTWDDLLAFLADLPAGQPWRHNQAGDLPHTDGHLDGLACGTLSRASAHTRGWTYTHHRPETGSNAAILQGMNDAGGLTVNLSADNPAHADAMLNLYAMPTTCVVPEDHPAVSRTPAGRPLVVCPAQTGRKPDCASCLLCQDRQTDTVIAFRAHGSRKRKAEASTQD